MQGIRKNNQIKFAHTSKYKYQKVAMKLTYLSVIVNPKMYHFYNLGT